MILTPGLRWRHQPQIQRWSGFNNCWSTRASIPLRPILFGLFSAGSPPCAAFHAIDGSGYRFMAEQIAAVDSRNPITASRMAKVFSRCGSYGPERQRSCVRPSTSWPPSRCRRTRPRWCSCSRRNHHQHKHGQQQEHQPELSVAAPTAAGLTARLCFLPQGRSSDRPADRPSIGRHETDGFRSWADAHSHGFWIIGLSIIVGPACLVSVRQRLSPAPSHRSPLWNAGVWCVGSCRSVGPGLRWPLQPLCCHRLQQ